MKGKNACSGVLLPIVSAVTCAMIPDHEPFLLIMNQATYNDDMNQNESLCLPFQAEQHGVKFSLTPCHRKCADGLVGTQKIVIKDKEIPLKFDGRKLFLDIRTPSEDELYELDLYKLTSPKPFVPDSGENRESASQRRNKVKKIYKKYPGEISMEQCAGD